MSKKTTYIILIVAILGVVILYYYNKYNVAPAFKVSNLEAIDEQGTKYNFAALKGKKVIVSFYASWCGPCNDELKALSRIRKEKLADIEILAITDEGIERITSFKYGRDYPFTFLTLKAPFNTIGINSIPVTYLLNAKGEVVYNNVGYVDWEDDSTLAHLKGLMD